VQGEIDEYCVFDIFLDNMKPLRMDGDYFRMFIPLPSFDCGNEGSPSLENINKIEVSNPSDRNADICLDDIKIHF
jgi:hypothetical protein